MKQVYAIANQFDISFLQDLARLKFKICLEDGELDPKELADLIELVYATTNNSDRGLRNIVIREASCRSTELLRDESFAEMSRRNRDFTMELAM
jgi:hypothetical protein